MSHPSYSVLIRTYNSENVLPHTLELLEKQTLPPSKYIFVDSGSTDRTLQIFPKDSIIHRYRGDEFNYSESLNQGLTYVLTEFVLIISSHTLLPKSDAVEFALNLLGSEERIGAAYFDNENFEYLQYRLIDKHNFDGFNGLWNTCALVRMALLKRRGFRPEVFAAEDQEWARWLFFSQGKYIARISGAGMGPSLNCNPRSFPLRKRLNEYVAIAYFSNRKLLGWLNIARVGFRVIHPVSRISMRERYFNLLLFFRLFACCFSKPAYKSKYF